MPVKEFPDKLKKILKRVPGIHGVNKIRLNIIRIRELSNLINGNRIIIFPDYSKMENNTLTRPIVYEIVKEWLDLYGVIHLRRTTAAAIDTKARSTLLWVPMAMLEVPTTYEEYIKGVERETRRVIRMAEKQGYQFNEFNWDDHLGDIYEINTSKEIRQSEPMRGWYREPVQPRHQSKEELQFRKYYGAFRDGKLCAYFHFYICGGVAVGKHFLGHAQHLRFGIMNGLISYTIRECIKNPQVNWLNYGDWQRRGSLNAFKLHAGFKGYAILLDLKDYQDLITYSKQKIRTVWRI